MKKTPDERSSWLADLAAACNSDLAQYIGFALVILSVLLGIGGCLHLAGGDTNFKVN